MNWKNNFLKNVKILTSFNYTTIFDDTLIQNFTQKRETITIVSDCLSEQNGNSVYINKMINVLHNISSLFLVFLPQVNYHNLGKVY